MRKLNIRRRSRLLDRGVLALLAAALAATLTACGAGGSAVTPGPSVGPSQVPYSYVAVGASETVGFGADEPVTQAWPQVFFHRGLPASTVFTNLGIPGETVAGALTDELPQALALTPRLVTVWLNVNDALAQVGTADYRQQLERLVHGLRRSGATTVLVANTPPLDQLPAYLACLGPADGARCRVPDPSILPQPQGVRADVDAYNAAIAAVCTQEGATLVDLHAVGERAEQDGSYASFIGSDGFHPSTRGHALIAAAFTAAAKAAGVPSS